MRTTPGHNCSMIERMRRSFLAFVFATAAVLPAGAENLHELTGAMLSAAQRDWPAARLGAARSGPIAVSLIDWQRLRAGQGSWSEYRDFAAAHGDWPGMDLLYRRGEAVLRPGLPAAEVIAWFGARTPETVVGARALIAALKETTPDAVLPALRAFWTTQPLTAADEKAFLAEFPTELAGLNDARAIALLDLGEWQAAERMLTHTSAAVTPLARARVAVQAGRAGVDKLILALPKAQQNDAGLALDRFRWRQQAKLGDLARELMLERSTSAEALRDPAAWAGLRADYARADLRTGNWARAEQFAANHFLPADNSDASDLEWLAGYAALRAGAPDRALVHFDKLAGASATPITQSRALYWQARAHEAKGDAAEAAALYQRAAQHQTAFYGQLAAEKAGVPMQAELALPGPAIDSLPDWRGSKLTENPLWQAGVWQIAAGFPDQGQRFFLHLAETAEPDDIARMARLMIELRMPWHAVRLAKAAAGKGGIYPAAYFPLTGLESDYHGGVPTELVMSIARRESEFNHRVTSHAGAKGLMQVMPDTARMMANRLAEPYELPRLTEDAAYNARLGAAYLKGLQDQFGYSVALIASGYNAGPGRPARWLGEFGDLRQGADPIDWVEMIPFDETRNYVMRVAEALPIYRARIMGKPAPLVPTFDLTGGGLMPVPPQPPIRLAYSARPRMSPMLLRAAAAGGIVSSVVPPPILTEALLPAREAILPADAPVAADATR